MKRTKKLLAVVLAACMLFALSACAQPAAPAVDAEPTAEAPVQSDALYTAGTYSATAQGNNGGVTVSVAFSDSAILSVEVSDHSETAGVGDVALDKLSVAVVEGQTLALDAITGATNSSVALLQAVEDCVKQAGGDVDALKVKSDANVVKDNVEMSADVVVIGGGGAGLSAAISASESGASVILLEKGAAVGGNTLLSGGMFNAADPEMAAQLTMGESELATLAGYLDLTAEEVGDFAPTLDTLKAQITEYLAGDTTKGFDSPELHIIQCCLGSTRQDLDGNWITPDYELIKTLCYNALDSWKWLCDMGVTPPEKLNTALGALWRRTHTPVGSAPALIKVLQENAEKAGAQILTEVRAQDLVVNGGKVTGVNAVRADGASVSVSAAKAVIIATGGFGGSTEMVAKYNNYWEGLTANSASDNTPNCTGDGIVMAQAVGAGTVGMGFIQLLPTCTYKDAKTCGVGTVLYLNKEGKRYVSEDSERDILCAAAFAQTDGIVYGIGDADLYNHQNWGAEKVALFVKNGYSYCADTLEEVCEQAGLDVETAVNTINTFNTYVDAQKDPDFGRYMLTDKVDTPPYVINVMAPAIHHTMGGLTINVDTQVLDTDGNAIAGLYAAGEVCGGIHAGNRLGGNAVADAVVFGRIAGINAAK